MSGLTVNRTRLLAYLAYCLALALIFAWTTRFLPYPGQTEALALAFLVGAIVPVALVFRARLDLLEPVHWFAAMYYFFFLGAVYFILTDFQHAQHNLIVTRDERDRVLLHALMLVLAGFVAFVVGYFAASARVRREPMRFASADPVPDWMLDLTVLVLLAIGLANFVYLVANYPGGLTTYYAEMGLRQHRLREYGEGVTTAGLQLFIAAVWFSLFVVMRRIRLRGSASTGRRLGATLIALFSIAVVTSQGRLFQTVSFCLAIAAMIYAFSSSPRRNRSMVLAGAGLFGAGLALYFGRLLSVLLHNRPELFAELGLRGVIETFFTTLNRLLIDGGNVTDLTSLMNIVAYWERDFPFLYGESFLSVFSRLLPGVEFRSVAEITQPVWSTGIGAWPPTFVGELYANFGTVGVLAGMLVAGFVAGRVYAFCARRGTFWATLLLCAITFRFLFILPKGETVNLAGPFWLVVPTFVTLLVMLLASAALEQSARKPGAAT